MPYVINFIRVILILAAVLSTGSGSFASLIDNPGGDQPDESFVLGDALYPRNIENVKPNTDARSKVAVLDNGYSRESVLFWGLYLPVRFVKEEDFLSQHSSISLFVIPSGGLSYLKDPGAFKLSLDKFVKNGGTLFVFSQRFGRDFALLPVPDGDSISGYGWLEDQSSLAYSSILTLLHPVVSRLDTSRPHINIDGVFTVVPRRCKAVLRNSISGQTVMCIYKEGWGNVIMSTLFTDWAYIHSNITRDEVRLFSRILRWTGFPLLSTAPEGLETKQTASVPLIELPSLGFSIQSDDEIYTAGSTATFTINLWNNDDKKKVINVYYDGNGNKVNLLPRGSAQVKYSVPVYSTRRLWVYFFNEEEVFLQTLKKGYMVVYPPGEGNNEANR